MDRQQLNLQLVEITSNIALLETQLKQYKELTKKYEAFRDNLFALMTEYNVDKFTSNEGTQFTIVQGSPEKIEIVRTFNEERFKKDQPDVYKQYVEQQEKITKARSSYLRITSPKEKEE